MASQLPNGVLIRCLTCGAPEYQGARNGPFAASRALHGQRALPVGICGICYREALQAVYRSWLLRRFTLAQRRLGSSEETYLEVLEAAHQLAANIGPKLIGVFTEHEAALRARFGVADNVENRL